MPKKDLLVKIGSFALAILGIYIFFKYILELVAPFVVASMLAGLLNPFVTLLHQKLRLSRGLGTLTAMFTILTAIFWGITFLIQQIYEQIIAIRNAYPIYRQQIEEFVNILDEQITRLTEYLPVPEAFTSIDGIITQILNYVGQSLEKIVPYAYDIVSIVPASIFFLIIMLISTFFMTKDYYVILEFFRAQLSSDTREKIVILQGGLKSALAGYIRTQLILMTFTFSICLVGLYILQRDNVLVISLGIAIFDAFPALGSGAILITWGVFHLLLGSYPVGFGLLAVYGLIVIMRQVLEPRVLSGQIGMYALITVMSMYIGLKTMGAFGIILGPIIAIILQTLQQIGILPSFKKVPENK
ncbi:MAG: sporulation integral membrane protein YtvI [Epulopiscium sp. Nele67-Bin005]|nr:MAG: sporulation integral membrane protein YtvI [Epulopiscium sp. Nele67-Bin005]